MIRRHDTGRDTAIQNDQLRDLPVVHGAFVGADTHGSGAIWYSEAMGQPGKPGSGFGQCRAHGTADGPDATATGHLGKGHSPSRRATPGSDGNGPGEPQQSLCGHANAPRETRTAMRWIPDNSINGTVDVAGSGSNAWVDLSTLIADAGKVLPPGTNAMRIYAYSDIPFCFSPESTAVNPSVVPMSLVTGSYLMLSNSLQIRFFRAFDNGFLGACQFYRLA